MTNEDLLEDFKQLMQATLSQAMANLATKDDLVNFATKDDIANFATKDDLANFATKDDLANFATKDDLANLATKQDITDLRDEMHDAFAGVGEAIDSIHDVLDQHDQAIKGLRVKHA